MVLSQTLASIFQLYTFLMLESFDISLRPNDISPLSPRRFLFMSGDNFFSRENINKFNSEINKDDIMSNSRKISEDLHNAIFNANEVSPYVVVGIAGNY